MHLSLHLMHFNICITRHTYHHACPPTRARAHTHSCTVLFLVPGGLGGVLTTMITSKLSCRETVMPFKGLFELAESRAAKKM